jgi:hypothetical protein
MRASISSVFAKRLVARAKSLTVRGFTTATGRPRAARQGGGSGGAFVAAGGFENNPFGVGFGQAFGQDFVPGSGVLKTARLHLFRIGEAHGEVEMGFGNVNANASCSRRQT